jgi:transposase
MTCGSKRKNRQFPTAYKLKAIKRVERGEGVLPVARELGISRKILHDWIKAWEGAGAGGIEPQAGTEAWPRKLTAPTTYDDKRSALSHADDRISEIADVPGVDIDSRPRDGARFRDCHMGEIRLLARTTGGLRYVKLQRDNCHQLLRIVRPAHCRSTPCARVRRTTESDAEQTAGGG